MAVFSFIISGRTPMRDLIGIGVGHVLWYLDEEWPRRPESNGIRILEAPMFIKRLFGGARAEEYLDSGAQDSVPVTTDQSVPPLQANNEDDVSSHVTQPSAESSNTGGDANKIIQDGFKKPLTPSNESADDSMKDVFRESATYSKSSTPIDSKITSESTTTSSSTLKNDENDLRHRAK
ncbi:hypothetical protein AX774_g3933 [Zancudomyces culisetae]|uniref:Uncharacterized protein n=1 Tax=Zancudomyces culisetae TaxID=1213189 RepID=A0A1R1PNR1_ZANCU|nr:hypothetical protein AX774_g3933 [Zancudomyces culisetae]|eukprot:OMH82581.1 hypothetical protein AX774_g3933 [Zancudomyces culisetae]